MSEKRSFKMHARLLYEVIQRQAGTLSKAILEGVMNAVDAGAKSVSITLAPKEVRISDDGKGFVDRHEIENFFETFGEPHKAHEKKVYGQFRMGRGQMFAFGINDWQSGVFEMVVDIKGQGLEYQLHEHKKARVGCHITIDLYTELLPSDLDTVARDIKQAVKYVAIPVKLNGDVVSRDPAKEKWDEITPDAYIRFSRAGGVKIYNLGVFVTETSSYHFGTGGEVVSKQQLRVNFARNDVMSDCPIWKRIKKVVDQRATQENKARPRLDDAGRQRLADQWRRGELEDHEFDSLKVFADVTGRHWSYNGLRRWGRWRTDTLCTVAPEGDASGDKIMQTKLAFVFSADTLERFEVKSVAGLLKVIRGGDEWRLRKWKPVAYDEVKKQVSQTYTVIPEQEYTPRERALLAAIDHGACYALREFSDLTGERLGERRLVVGLSSTAQAWTDGRTFIALNRELLQTSVTLETWARWGSLLLHEYCHDDPNTDTHNHTPEFYRLFHDAKEFIAKFVQHAISFYPTALKRQRLKTTRRELKQQDLLARTAQEEAQAALVKP